MLEDASGSTRTQKLEEKSAEPVEDAKEESKGESPLVKEDQVLQMDVDPTKVTTEGLDQYENLMKGNVTYARSNASYQSGSRNLMVMIFTRFTLGGMTQESKLIKLEPLS